MGARMDDAIHVKVEIVEFLAIRIRSSHIDRYLLTIYRFWLLLDDL